MISWLFGGISKALLKAYEVRLQADNDQARLDADLTIQRLENARALALSEAAYRFSATRLGRWLIVVPFGVWWAAIFLDSTLDTPFTILAIPADIMEMAKVLIPAIVLADAGALLVKARK